MCDYTVDTLLEIGRLKVMWADRCWHGGVHFARALDGLYYTLLLWRLEITYSAPEEELMEWYRANYNRRASSPKCG